jgi:hypothetical protein
MMSNKGRNKMKTIMENLEKEHEGPKGNIWRGGEKNRTVRNSKAGSSEGTKRRCKRRIWGDTVGEEEQKENRKGIRRDR